MKLTTDKYIIEYMDSYTDGVEVDWFRFIVGDVVIDLEYSQDKKDIISYSVNEDLRVIEGNNMYGEDATYIYAEAEALKCFEYAKYEIKKVCSFMIDLM